jgi:hypothetical protein
MKFKIIVMFCFFAMLNGVKAHRIVDIQRSNGFFGFYGTVDQSYMGTINGEPWWNLYCHGWGTTRCKMRYISTGSVTHQEEEVTVSEDNTLGDLMDAVETNEISVGVTTGETFRHYQTTLSDNSVVDIYIALTWAPDPNDTNGSVFHATITNSLD